MYMPFEDVSEEVGRIVKVYVESSPSFRGLNVKSLMRTELPTAA